MRSLLVLTAVFLLVLPAWGKEAEEATPQPHADEDVDVATARFELDYAAKDMDKRLRILEWYGLYMHKDVLKRLKRIWLKERNVELQAAAAKGLGNQLPFPKKASAALMEGLEKYDKYATREEPEGDEELAQELEARALANAIKALAVHKVKPDKKGWKMLRGFIDHNHDEVAIAMLNWCGTTKEWRSLPVILEWFNFYPDGYSWAGGSVSVDTGAAGNRDANAAKAKWKAKYGSRARKARPKAHEAMRKALKDITGVEFEKADELKEWMKENKQLLKKHGV